MSLTNHVFLAVDVPPLFNQAVSICAKSIILIVNEIENGNAIFLVYGSLLWVGLTSAVAKYSLHLLIMTPWHGNVFPIIGHLGGESTSHLCIPCTESQ